MKLSETVLELGQLSCHPHSALVPYPWEFQDEPELTSIDPEHVAWHSDEPSEEVCPLGQLLQDVLVERRRDDEYRPLAHDTQDDPLTLCPAPHDVDA